MFLHLHILYISNLTLTTTLWLIPDTADTVVCAPDDGWWYHLKEEEQFTDINCVKLHLVGYILGYLKDYSLNGISTNFQKYPINTAIHCLCYRHKNAQIVPKQSFHQFLLYKYKPIGGSYLEIPTGPDSAWSDTPLVEPVCKGNRV